MPVILRNPNNPAPDSQVLAAFKVVVPGFPTPNTRIAASSVSQNGSEQIFIQSKFAMFQAGLFPAVLLSAAAQHYTRMSRATYDGALTVNIDYYDNWTTSGLTNDQTLAAIAADLERIKANIEDNDSLTAQTFGNSALVISIPSFSLSPYDGTIHTDAGSQWVWRRLTASLFLLPYDV